MLYSLFFFFFFLLLVPGCFSLKMRAKCKWRLWGKMGKKESRRDFTLLFSVSGFRFVFARTRTQRYARRRQKEREKEGSRTPVVVFAGSYAKHAPFVYVKVTAKRERDRVFEFGKEEEEEEVIRRKNTKRWRRKSSA